MGRIDEILPQIPVYMSDLSRQIFERVFCFSPTKGKIKRETTNIEDEKPLKIKDFTITPYTVDHSAYNSFMLLIEVEGKRILHTGDFRNHGYKGKILSKTLKKIGKIDLLITEGTTFSREQIKNKTEAELVNEIREKAKNYDQVLMLMSTTNIDRVTTMQKVANRTNKTVIHDIALSNVLSLVTQRIPNALNSDKVYVFLPAYYYIKKDMPEYRQYVEPYQAKIQMTGKQLHKPFIMNIRVSMLRDIEKLKSKSKVLDNACVIYSMWEGYKEQDIFKNFLAKMEKLDIDVYSIHTSRTF
jgi:ribonuclease J